MGVELIKNKGKICLTLVIIIFLITTIVPVPITAEYKQSEDVNSNVTITLTFDVDDFEFEKYNGYDIISYPDGGLTTDIGKPMLPLKNILVALPSEIKATNIRIIDFVEDDIASTFNIMPAQAPQKVGQYYVKPTFSHNIGFYKFIKLYSSETVELIGMTDLAGQGIAIVTVYPFQYNPYLNTLKFLREVKFEIEGEIGYTCGDFLPAYISKTEIDFYKEKVREMVVNPEDIKLQTNEGIQPLGIDPGDYDYVIITKNSWVSAFQTLANWKTQKGIPANIVTTESIYANYSGSTNQAKIRAFIQDAHSNWGSTFFLLGGDNDTIPYHTVTYLGDDIPTDTYYSDYDDDWTLEVHVGRASVTGTGTGVGKIGNFISKILTYEKNPPTTNYAKNISLFGFDLDWTTEGEDCKIDIDDLYIPSGWNVTKVYDSHSGNHEDNVDTAVNSGQNIINHIDHCNQYYIGIGYKNHDWGLNTSEVDAFSNGNKQSIWYSIGCLAAAFDYSNCIAEHIVRDKNGGGVAFVGNTRSGWYYVGGDDLASLRYDRYFFRSFFDQNHYKLGDLFSDHKMDAYNSMDEDDYNKYIFSELSLLGDPELPLWMDNPESFDVFHPSEILIGPSSFTVHVENSSGSDVENAYVCLWKGDEVYLTNYTDSSGNVTFNPSPSTEGNMTVTVTKQDYLPYENNVDVTSNQPPNTPSEPNPEDGATGVSINTGLSWNCSDPDGDPLTYNVYFGDSNPPPLISSNQTSKFFLLVTLDYETTYYWMIVVWDDSGEFNQSPIWSFTTEDEPVNFPPEYSDENPLNGATNIPIVTSSLSVYISDSEGDSFDWTIETSPNIGSIASNNEYNGTKTCTVSGLEFSTVYSWYVNATDSGSGDTTSEVYTFTTESEENNPPDKPTIDGPISGKPGISYNYSFTATDPDGDIIWYYIEWGDETNTGWIGPFNSSETIIRSHTWITQGYYTIKAKAKDLYDEEGPEETLTVTMPRNRIAFHSLFLRVLERFPNTFQILRYILGLQ